MATACLILMGVACHGLCLANGNPSRARNAEPSASSEKLQQASPGVFLSDMPFKSVSTQDNLVHRDENYYHNQASISGKAYPKSLWTHAFGNGGPADLTFDIGGKGYFYFAADASLDDASGGGSIQFQVLVDGVLKAESKVLAPRKKLSFLVSIVGGTTLTLRVLNGGDGNNCDHALWGYARLATAEGAKQEPSSWPGADQPHPAGPSPGSFLSDLTIKWASTQDNLIYKDQNYYGGFCAISGKRYLKSTWVHAFLDARPSDVVFDIAGKGFEYFCADAGLDDASGGGSVQFQVLVDDVARAESGVLCPRQQHPFRVSVAGASTLTLRVLNGGDGNNCDHAVWGYARMTMNASHVSDPEDWEGAAPARRTIHEIHDKDWVFWGEPNLRKQVLSNIGDLEKAGAPVKAVLIKLLINNDAWAAWVCLARGEEIDEATRVWVRGGQRQMRNAGRDEVALKLSIPVLMQLRKDGDPAVRRRAVKLLAGSGAEEARSAVLEAANDPDPETRSAAISIIIQQIALWPGDEPTLALIKMLDDSDSNIRLYVAQALGVYPPVGGSAPKPALVIPALIHALNRGEEPLTLAVCLSLERLAAMPEETVPALTNLLNERSPNVRSAAAVALNAFGERAAEAVPKLLALYEDPNEPGRLTMLIVVSKMGKGGLRLLPSLLRIIAENRSGSWEYKTAMDNLVKLGPPAVDLLIEASRDRDSRVRLLALQQIRQSSDRSKVTVVALGEALRDSEAGIRKEAINTLYAMGKAALPALPNIIESCRDEHLMFWAISLLRDFGSAGATAVPTLIQCVGDPKGLYPDFQPNECAQAKALAISTLATMGDAAAPAVPLLINALESQDRKVRLAAIGAIADLGPLAEPAAPRVIEAFDKGDRETRLAAVPILERYADMALPHLPKIVDLIGGQPWAINDNGRPVNTILALAEASLQTSSKPGFVAPKDALRYWKAAERALVHKGATDQYDRPALNSPWRAVKRVIEALGGSK